MAYVNNYDYSKHHHTIVCDLDDTLSVCTTHNWENATPIWPVIEKINKMYENGWQIIILTARGQVSCKGDCEKADKKYRAIIEKWLKKHKVKYHILSFNKYLGSIYIDDKGFTPEDFIDFDYEEIKFGWSTTIRHS